MTDLHRTAHHRSIFRFLGITASDPCRDAQRCLNILYSDSKWDTKMAFEVLRTLLTLAVLLHASRLVNAKQNVSFLFHATTIEGHPNMHQSSIEWGPCEPNFTSDPTLSCAFFEIPLDYHNSSAGRGRLALAKLNATVGVSERLGTMFFNPGKRGAIQSQRSMSY